MTDDRLEEELRRAPAGTRESLATFKATNSPVHLETFIRGIVARNIDETYEVALEKMDEHANFVETLGIDSLTMIEIVMTLEDALEIPLMDDSLQEKQTFHELKEYIIGKRIENAG